MFFCCKDLLKKKVYNCDMIIIKKIFLDCEKVLDKYDLLIINLCVDDFLVVVCVVIIYIIFVVFIGFL